MRQFLKSLVVISLFILGASVAAAPRVHADPAQKPCSANPTAIVCGGTSRPDYLVNIINHSADQDNLQAIYANYGLHQRDYTAFGANNQNGTLYKDGTIKVDGKTVGRSTLNLARVRTDTFTQKVVINGHTYWGGSFANTYHADQADVLVLMKNGVLKAAIISDCGNPQQIETPPAQPPTPPKPTPQPPKPQPTYSCDKLYSRRVGENRYEFHTAATAQNGAKITAVGYDFGDGQPKITGSIDKYVQHTFSKSANVTSIVQVTLPDNSLRFAISLNCTAQITVKNTPPAPAPSSGFCSGFQTPELLNADTREYRFTVTANTTNAHFDRAEFYFSDNPSAVIPAAVSGNAASITHSFAEAKQYQVTARLFFTGADGKQSHGDCSYQLTTTTPPANQCGKGSDDDAGKGSEDTCQLTDTGPGTMIAGLFGGAGVLGAVGHYVVRRRLLGI